MGRSIYCSTCKNEKEPGRDNESRCKACKSQANKEKRAKKRAEAGLEAYGTGRSLYCYDCKSVKEKREYGYCNACRRKKDNENRLAKGVTKKHQTGLCPCGAERASYSKAYCVECLSRRAKERRVWEDFTPEQRARRNELQNARYRQRIGELEFSQDPINIKRRQMYQDWIANDEERIYKIRVRSLTRSYIKAGKLIKQPCEVCGYDKYVEAHHDDYNKPMDIRWLCRNHHREHHQLND